MQNFIEIKETFRGWMDIRMYVRMDWQIYIWDPLYQVHSEEPI